MLKKTIAIALVALCGCLTVQPEVQVTKPWENHYMTAEEFKAGTASLQLEEGESVWVLSNKTLSRLLKNYIKTGK